MFCLAEEPRMQCDLSWRSAKSFFGCLLLGSRLVAVEPLDFSEPPCALKDLEVDREVVRSDDESDCDSRERWRVWLLCL